MQAIVIHAAKDLRIEERATRSPGPGQVSVRIHAGGICGSDLHYFHRGGFGAIRLREPMVPGHEVAGVISALGAGVEGLAPGDRVAINPSLPCLNCEFCRRAQFNHCTDMRFYGSAMRFPHVQGAFSQDLVCEARQCEVVPPETDLHHAAFAEPLSVALHAIKRAGELCGGLAGRRVFVSGCGPIGALAVMAARHAGALEVVAADVTDHVLSIARKVGADHTVNVASDRQGLSGFAQNKGHFDLVIEASGAQPAIDAALEVVRPRGIVVQLGLGGDMTLPMNTCVAKEISLVGSFRFHEEFAWAAALIGSGAIDVSPLLSAAIPVADAVQAFELAGDRERAVKVHIAFH